MDKNKSAIANVTVPANMLNFSVEIRKFSSGNISIVANRKYNITVTAISDQRTSYPSAPVVVSKCLCTVIACIVAHPQMVWS